MGTRTAAARNKNPTPAPAPDEANKALEDIGAAMLTPFVQDGKFNVSGFLNMIENKFGPDARDLAEKEVASYFKPEGVIEMTVATWDCGLMGKVHTGVTIAGYALVGSLVLEGIGALLDIPQVRIVSWASRKVLGD